MTDDTKQATTNTGEWYSHLVLQDLTKLHLNSSQLKTIAIACQSPLAIHQLLDSGLPYLLTNAILEYCQRASPINKTTLIDDDKTPTADEPTDSSSCVYQSLNITECLTDADKVDNRSAQSRVVPLVTVEMIAEILDFFAESCSEGHMRDWLGSSDGSEFWQPLLDLLCNEKHNEFTSDLLYSYSKLEAATIKFLSKVTSCHPKNQENLTIILISVIKKPNNQSTTKNIISGFTRRLVLQLLLESERILVSVRSEFPLQKRDCFLSPINDHPSKRPNAHNILFYLSTHTKCQEILDNCVYNNLLTPNMNNGGGGNGTVGCSGTGGSGSSVDSGIKSASSLVDSLRDKRKEFFEVNWNNGMGYGMESLSVAAGVTAKDKRFKEAKNQAQMKAKDMILNSKLNFNAEFYYFWIYFLYFLNSRI